MLDKLASRKIELALNGIDKDEQLQSYIHEDLNFKRNSINILISRRGVGKTFAVMKELIKLSHLPNFGNYTQFIYITDKMNDSTVNELIKLIKIKTRVVKYEDAYQVLKDIMESKTAYEQIIEKKLQNKLKESSRDNILSTLDVDGFGESVPHSAILFDDAINIFKETKFKPLKNLLFQNRQPRFTIFICLQDIFSIPPQIKRNADSVWIFTGFTDKTMFGMMCKQLGSPIKSDELWEIYQELEYRNALIFVYDPDGIKINILNDN
jgi:hypothetical protein